MNDTFYILEKYSPFSKKWGFLDSARYKTLEAKRCATFVHSRYRSAFKTLYFCSSTLVFASSFSLCVPFASWDPVFLFPASAVTTSLPQMKL